MQSPKFQKIVRWLLTVSVFLALMFALSNVTRTQKFWGVDRVDTADPVVALTYDDGPAMPYTLQLLEVLDRHQVKATFFAVGQRVLEHPQVVQQVLQAGHELGNHSLSHQDLLFKQTYYLWREIGHTDQLLRSLGTPGIIHFRPPRGRGFLGSLALLKLMHKQLIMWDVDPADYKKKRSPEDITRRVLRRVRPGSIVLLHDGGGDRARTVLASDRIITALKAQGYRFLTISELLQQSESSAIAPNRTFADGFRTVPPDPASGAATLPQTRPGRSPL